MVTFFSDEFFMLFGSARPEIIATRMINHHDNGSFFFNQWCKYLHPPAISPEGLIWSVKNVKDVTDQTKHSFIKNTANCCTQ